MLASGDRAPTRSTRSTATAPTVAGWPVRVGVAAGDLLPMVLPGHDAAMLDEDADPGDDEVSVSAATSITPGGTRLVDGERRRRSASTRPAPANSPDNGPVLNLADYSSVGDILGPGQPAVLKGGLTAERRRQPARGQPEPPLQPRRAGLGSRPPAPRCPGYPGRRPTTSSCSPRPRSPGSAAPAPARQVLVGTGLYNLHAYGAGGTEPAGWPKFTGGWQQATPAVGDADGDGDLDVTTVTREGWSFLWDTATGVDRRLRRTPTTSGGPSTTTSTRPTTTAATAARPARPSDLIVRATADGGVARRLDRPRRRLALRRRPASSA